MFSAAVAAGEGALHTFTIRPLSRIKKSSTNDPSGRNANARTPDGEGKRSSTPSSGSSRRAAERYLRLLSDWKISATPLFQLRAASRLKPLKRIASINSP